MALAPIGERAAIYSDTAWAGDLRSPWRVLSSESLGATGGIRSFRSSDLFNRDYSTMSNRHQRHIGANGKRCQNRLSLERLEARLMFAIDALESDIAQLLSPSPATGTSTAAIVFNPSTGTTLSNQVATAAPSSQNLQSTTGSQRSTLSSNATPRLTGLGLFTSAGIAIDTQDPIEVAGTSQRFVIRGIDQFGNPMTSPLKLTVTTIQKPSSSRLDTSVSGTNVTLTFNRTGSYLVRATAGSMRLQFRINVIPTLTSIRVSTPQNQSLVANNTLEVTGTSQRLNAVGIDQFGSVMSTQPEIAWRTLNGPAGGEATLTANGNQIAVAMSKVGVYTLRAEVGNVTSNARLNVVPTLTSLSASTTTQEPISRGTAVVVTDTGHRILVRGNDQFGNSIASLPTIMATISKKPPGAKAAVAISSRSVTMTFDRAGQYTIALRSGGKTTNVSYDVQQTLKSVSLLDNGNSALGRTATIDTRNITLSARGVDQFGQPMKSQPQFTWAVAATPRNGAATVTTTSNRAVAAFDRVGQYTLRATSGAITIAISVTVQPKLASLEVTQTGDSVERGSTRQFRVAGLDQFGQPISGRLDATWSATGGRISSSGVFTAGSRTGEFRITAKIGRITDSIKVTVVAQQPQNVLSNQTLASLVESFYADSTISRAEMIQILRSAGNDGSVDASELADLRFLASGQTNYDMPAHVRELAKSVVTANPANAKFNGQNLGNLAVGSNSVHLNKLVDKWFLGADLPTITGSGITYQNAVGSLFVGTPSLQQGRQGYLGDCYFIATMTSIAAKNVSAIQDMFIDNGDNTFTVRFFGGSMGSFYQNGLISSGFISGAGVASYVTVNRQLPTLSNGSLAYSGLGLSASSSSTPLWVALAEKAYAQWNELGKSGRDGTNRYAAIEGGWMFNTNSQVLGYNSTNYPLSSTSKQTLINSLSGGNAVTIGTNANVGAGLVGGHAYVITGYNASTDRFNLYNPWGSSHPSPLSWQQLQANCSQFIVTATSGSVSSLNSVVYSSINGVPSLLSSAIMVASDFDPSVASTETVEGPQHVIDHVHSIVTSSARSFASIDVFMDYRDAVANNSQAEGASERTHQVSIYSTLNAIVTHMVNLQV